MSTNRNNLNTQFKSAIQDAINRGDFTKLKYLITDTVSDAIAGTNISYKKPMPITKVKQVGRVSSILFIIFGTLGTVGSGITLLSSGLILLFSTQFHILPALAFFAIALAGFVSMLVVGIKQDQRLSRMKRYIKLCDDNMYINLSDLASHTHKTLAYVRKDIKKMLKLGFFPEGHLDKKESCLMLDHDTYREYLRVEQQRSQLEAETHSAPSTEENPVNTELQTMISEGQDYIAKLHHLNDIIEDAVVSEKLYRMEELLKKLFERLEESPNQMPKMRKLMNYYLPTTIKLLQAYSEFDDVNTPNQDIISAKAEIEKTIDIINEAFTELLNKLFQESAFDASTDAQVLQTMLAKEGLTKNKMTEEP